MDIKKLFFTNVNISHGGAKLLRNATAAFLGLYSYAFYGQVQKLDSRFDIVLKNKENIANGRAVKELERPDMKLDQHLVVTSKGAQTMYSCIVYTKEPEKLKEDGFLVQSQFPAFSTALVSIEDIERLIHLPYVTSVMAPEFDALHNDVSRAQSGASLLQDGVFNNTAYNGTGVLVGIYDSGIDWKHPDFRKADDQTKSRIVSIWDQTLTAQAGETAPVGFATGVEYTRAQIEDELDGTPTGFVRENDINGHGTHVSGTAAGNGSAFTDKRHKGFSSDADIVFVKGGNGSFPTTNTINALTYFKNVATALNKPIVVNMSIGGQSSAHDGTSSHEVAVNNFTTSGAGRVVVISAGNDYGANLHRKVDIAVGAAQTYNFTVASNTSATSVFSFIMYANDNTPVTAKLTTPDGQQYTQNISTTTAHTILGGGLTATMYNYWSNDNNKRYVQLVVTRTSGTTNVQGNYTLEITNNGTQQISAHGWLYSQGVQTTLQNGDNEYIVGSPGNASNAITVASYMGRASWYSGTSGYFTLTPQESISSFSAQGPRVDGVQKPDIAGSGQNVISSRSADSAPGATDIIAGTNYYVKNQGTSMSSPGVAGAVGLLLQANPSLTAAQVKARLTANARVDGATGTVPNMRWGYGKLDIYKAVTDELGCVKSNFETVGYDEPYIIANTESNYYFDNIALAVRYTPTLTGKLGGFSFLTGTSLPSDIPVDIQIRKVNASGNPGDIIATKTITSWLNSSQRFTWNYVNLSDLNVQMVTGKEFYIVINGLGGRIAMKAENAVVNNRSKTSTDGTAWTSRTFDLKMRAIVYENVAEVKNLATSNQTKASMVSNGYNYFTNSCQLISRLEKETASTVTGNVTSKVWVDNAQPNYVARRYEINSDANTTTATGKVTLYFKQSDFDAYNLTNGVKLPTSPTDVANKANLLIEKYSGTSTTGTVASFGGTATVITPDIADIIWNDTYQYWEVSFQTTGFGGYFVKTGTTLGTADVKINSEVNITPNPAKDFVNVSLGRHSKGAVSVYDASGKLIKTVNVDKNSGRIDVSELVRGTYLFTITLEDNTKITKKVMKQ
ncbi:subtilisin family serine protease [Chryseobacterium bernardetii]|uniref:Subtilisin family serine protease n=2 Tax=Chryseobacterium TaxID=59732 RepID=A0ACC6IP29_9FLAO|nr:MULTISPECIES: S8/S53 family peptidase [Chryseobacterium]MDR6369580.1 subtilisin family serine protease [Chryseobacterium vietnamense]MDR6439498.1 subtilisin family serine protease [Chryseobacterium bernardetii]TQM23188.1 putative secreted protein (Por secretion system target) [Chryseobacterium aquifrigidense]